MLVDNSIASYARHVSRNDSQDGGDHIPLISFVYHCQSFLFSHRQSVKEGLLVVIIFCELGALMPVDMSQTYLLFQTLFLLFCPHSCMIWTKLTRTNAVFSRASCMVYLCARKWIFRRPRKFPENPRTRRSQEPEVGPEGS